MQARLDSSRTSARGRWSVAVALTALAVALVTAVGAVRTSAQEAPTTVRVVHGLRGLVADIYIDGALALPTFQPERSTDPVAITPGDHLIEIRSGGASMSETPLLAQTVTVPPGFQGSLVAHLDPTGAPVLTAYADDLSAVPAGQSRVVVRHAAATADVSILVNGVPTVLVAPSGEASQVVGAGTYELAVAPAGGGEPLAAPQNVEFADGTANFMYLIGSQTDGTLGWAVVRVAGLQSAPAMIQTGDGSARPGGGVERYLLGAAGLAVGAGVMAWQWRTRRAGVTT